MKWKVGDKAKVNTLYTDSYFNVGAVGTVVEIHPDMCHIRLVANGERWWVDKKHLDALVPKEPVTINNICCNVEMEDISAFNVETDDEKLLYECSVCGTIYLDDGSKLESKIEIPEARFSPVEASPEPEFMREQYVTVNPCAEVEDTPTYNYNYNYTITTAGRRTARVAPPVAPLSLEEIERYVHTVAAGR